MIRGCTSFFLCRTPSTTIQLDVLVLWLRNWMFWVRTHRLGQYSFVSVGTGKAISQFSEDAWRFQRGTLSFSRFSVAGTRWSLRHSLLPTWRCSPLVSRVKMSLTLLMSCDVSFSWHDRDDCGRHRQCTEHIILIFTKKFSFIFRIDLWSLHWISNFSTLLS